MKVEIFELVKELIKNECKIIPRKERVPIIKSVMEQLVKKEPMTNNEKETWEELVIEIVNNYY